MSLFLSIEFLHSLFFIDCLLCKMRSSYLDEIRVRDACPSAFPRYLCCRCCHHLHRLTCFVLCSISSRHSMKFLLNSAHSSVHIQEYLLHKIETSMKINILVAAAATTTKKLWIIYVIRLCSIIFHRTIIIIIILENYY